MKPSGEKTKYFFLHFSVKYRYFLPTSKWIMVPGQRDFLVNIIKCPECFDD